MTRPQPARDNTCPSCGRDVGDGYYSQRKTCACGAWLICVMDSPTPRWILREDFGKPHLPLKRAYPPKEGPLTNTDP